MGQLLFLWLTPHFSLSPTHYGVFKFPHLKKYFCPMKPTKQYIAEKALELFNTKGFVNVRLQHIADAAFVSVGHLAYHFKNKDAIAEGLYDELRTQQAQLLNEFRVVPLFEDLNRYLSAVFYLQDQYIFFYLDTLEIVRAYPEIGEKHQQHIAWQLAQLQLMLDFNIARGSLAPLPPERVKAMAWQIRWLMDSWRYDRRIETDRPDDVDDFLNDVWGLLLPLLTDMGAREYQQLGSIE
jgi:AcrR family transcriptional regulator